LHDIIVVICDKFSGLRSRARRVSPLARLCRFAIEAGICRMQGADAGAAAGRADDQASGCSPGRHI